MSCAASSAHTFVQAHHHTSRPCFAASETGRHDVQMFLLEPVQKCTEEQIMQVPVLQIIEKLRNHMTALYVAFSLRPPSKESVEVPNMQVVVGALFWNFGSTTGRPRRIHILGTCSRSGVGRDQFVGDHGLGTETQLSGTESRHGPWSCRELGNPYVVVRCQPNVTCAQKGASVWLLLPRRDHMS